MRRRMGVPLQILTAGCAACAVNRKQLLCAQNIEVERKFLVPDMGTFRGRLAKMRATLKGEKEIRDTYFDTPELALSSRNRWLRRRNGEWEYKVPVALDRIPQHTAIFREVEGLEAVKRELAEVDGVVLEHVQPIASFVTTRNTWTCKGFTIDVDCMDFGYEIGEIELMVTEDQALHAVQKIEEFAKELGLAVSQEATPTTGKLETFLFRYNRSSFDRLVNAGVILPDPTQRHDAPPATVPVPML